MITCLRFGVIQKAENNSFSRSVAACYDPELRMSRRSSRHVTEATVTANGTLSPLLYDLHTPSSSPSIIALASRIYGHRTPSICTPKPSFPQALTSLSRCLELLKRPTLFAKFTCHRTDIVSRTRILTRSCHVNQIPYLSAGSYAYILVTVATPPHLDHRRLP
jgi:hypothetical protein